MSKLNPEKRKLGQVVVDFVNAKNTDEAAYTFFENIQDVMGYSSTFSEQAKKNFPSWHRFESLSASEANVLEFLVETRSPLERIPIASSHSASSFEIVKYDSKGRIFVKLYSYDTINEPTESEVHIEEFSCFPEELKKELADRVIPFESFFDDPEGFNYVRVALETLTKIEKGAPPFKRIRSKKNFEYLSNLAQQYEQFYDFHDGLIDLQENCRITIKMIMERSKLSDIPFIQDCLTIYNKWIKRILTVSENSFAELPPPAREKRYLVTIDPGFERIVRFLKQDISYCLIEFLRTPESRNYLHQCERCGMFFIKTKLDKRIKYCLTCSRKNKMSPEERREYQKKYRSKMKAEKKALKRKEMVRALMRKLDITEEEAVETIEADSKL